MSIIKMLRTVWSACIKKQICIYIPLPSRQECRPKYV